MSKKPLRINGHARSVERGDYTMYSGRSGRRKRHHQQHYDDEGHHEVYMEEGGYPAHVVYDDYESAMCCDGCYSVCCTGRGKWWWGCGAGFIFVVFLLAGAGLGVGIWAVTRTNPPLTQNTYTISQQLPPSPLSHVATGGAALQMTLPNDLTRFVGKVYNFDCGSTALHRLTFEAGPLSPTYDGANTIAECGGAVGDGFSFKVSSPTLVRITSNTNMNLS